MCGWANVHDEERSGRSSIVSVDKKICERRHFTMSELLYEFPQISRTVLYKTVTVRLDYHKFCARWVPKMLTGAYKVQNIFSCDFFRVILQRWWWISQSHLTSNRWWNLDFICECWNQRAIKAVDAHIHETSRKSLNKRLPARKLITVFWDRKGVLMAEFMQQNHNDVRRVLQSTKKVQGRPFRTKVRNADIQCSAPPWQCTSTCSCTQLNTTSAFQLGVVWPPSIQPWSHSKQLPLVYLPEELVGIMTLPNTCASGPVVTVLRSSLSM
jgi:hypothetical protein